jgi:GMP synthase (glutamine-hydrolysing)
MARILLISHEPEAAPAVVGEILEERGHDVDLHVVLADPASPDTVFPSPDAYDAVVAFGSFANAYDSAARVWVEPEIDFIKGLVTEDIPYLGVCFGGQLLAESTGGYVERAPASEQEIGLVSFPHTDERPVPAGPWFTWHEDRVVVPDSMDVLVRNSNAPQLFRQGRAVGTQFHPEVNVELVQSWLRIGGDHVPSHTTGDALIADLQAHEGDLRRNCAALVDWFLHDIADLT